jgi:acyl-coenzyme A synthetase/AMP-(fatty) acid ligase
MGDAINVGGNKLMPIEVESVILDVPGVIDCRAFGLPNALLGHVVAAEVVGSLDQNHESLRASIRQFCRTRLPAYKVPVSINFVPSIMGDRLKKSRTNQ